MADNQNIKVGFIGLGAMGEPMARNIKKAGYNLTVYNRNKAKAETLAKEGVTVANEPSETGRDANFVITMLADDAAVEQVMLGDKGVLQAMKAGAIYINMSTTSPELAQHLETEAQKQQIVALAAPVMGSVKPATDGTLVILADGDKTAFDKAEPLLKTMGQTIHYMGETGKALTMKLIANGFIQIQLAAFAELLSLAQKAGLDKQQTVEILTGGALASPWLKGKATNVLKNDYTPAFSLKLTRKDIGLAVQEMKRYSVPAPVTAATEQLYTFATNQGRIDEDMSVLVPLVAKLAGIED